VGFKAKHSVVEKGALCGEIVLIMREISDEELLQGETGKYIYNEMTSTALKIGFGEVYACHGNAAK
jgi:hypothetical protein